jgi:hypothetical protein
VLKVYDVGEISMPSHNINKEESLSALEVLGYPRKSSEKIVDRIINENKEASVEFIIKQALKLIIFENKLLYKSHFINKKFSFLYIIFLWINLYSQEETPKDTIGYDKGRVDIRILIALLMLILMILQLTNTFIQAHLKDHISITILTPEEYEELKLRRVNA